VVLSTKDVVSQHLSVIAATGSGKSYTVGVLIEEMLGPRNKGAVLIFDPHGEYQTLSEMVELPETLSEDYRPRVKVIRPDDIRIRYSDMELGDILAVMDDGNLSDKMRVLMNSVYRDVRGRARSGECNFTYDELRRELEKRREERPEDEATYTALLWRLSKLEGPIFHDHMHQDLDEFFSIGQVTVLDMSGIDERYQQLIATIILRRVFDARKGTVNKIYGPSTDTDKFLPYPVFMVFEEAHRFAPQNMEAKSKWMLKTILSEGRKFGLGVCLVSQRPAKLDQDSLSQCMTQITMRIINPVDQGQIAAAVEGLSRDLLDRLPSLAKGEAIISGMAINTPTVTRIRKRYTTHGGSDIDAPDEWDKGYGGVEDEVIPEDEGLNLDYLK
jgi:DNA helicase HerA-like ATPase